jgi:hypothetical protein
MLLPIVEPFTEGLDVVPDSHRRDRLASAPNSLPREAPRRSRNVSEPDLESGEGLLQRLSSTPAGTGPLLVVFLKNAQASSKMSVDPF